MFDESKHPRDNDGKFTSSDGAGGSHEATEAEKRRMREMGITVGGEKKKMTPAEKIASVQAKRLKSGTSLFITVVCCSFSNLCRSPQKGAPIQHKGVHRER